MKDLRFSIRTLSRTPALTTVVILSLALGIGANTAIFSLMRAVILNTLPVRDPQHLVLLHWQGEAWPKGLHQSGSGGPNLPASLVGSRSLAFPFFRELRQ